MREYRLEITMESQVSWAQKYIKRSFPVKNGMLDISGYGYPYDRYGYIEIDGMFERHDDICLDLKFGGEEINVYLNSFKTVKHEYQIVDPNTRVTHTEVVHTTFYLFIE